MKFLIDNALSPDVAAHLSSAGHDAVHVRDRGLAEAEDEVILELAVGEARVMRSAPKSVSAVTQRGLMGRPARGIVPKQDDRRLRLLSQHASPAERGPQRDSRAGGPECSLENIACLRSRLGYARSPLPRPSFSCSTVWRIIMDHTGVCLEIPTRGWNAAARAHQR